MMQAPRIPPRQPIGDLFNGVVLNVDGHALLAPSAQAGSSEVLHRGIFVVRYGVVYVGKPHLSIVPALLALDYGEFKTGEAAWDFLMNKSNLYPRADVIGHRNDGADDQVFVRELDLVHPLHVLVYENETATQPLAQVSALIAAPGTTLPLRLGQYATGYASVSAWQEEISA